jgi:hypothetical protein
MDSSIPVPVLKKNKVGDHGGQSDPKKARIDSRCFPAGVSPTKAALSVLSPNEKKKRSMETLVYLLANAKKAEVEKLVNGISKKLTIFKYEALVVSSDMDECPPLFTWTVWNSNQADRLKVGKFYMLSDLRKFSPSTWAASGFEYSAPFKFKEHTLAVDHDILVSH